MIRGSKLFGPSSLTGLTSFLTIFSGVIRGGQVIGIIHEYEDDRKNEIKADFFSDCSMIPDPTELSIEEKNLLILDDCYLGPQSPSILYSWMA